MGSAGKIVLEQRLLLDDAVQRHELLQQRLHVLERHRVRAVAEGLCRVGMGLHEEARHTHADARAGQHRHHLAGTAAGSALAARLLHGVGDVEHHGRAGIAHLGQAGHVGDEVVVAEADAAFAGQEAIFRQAHFRGGGAGLVDDVLHVPGREELALLDVHGLAALGDSADEVGLPAQEGGRLQHVDDGRHVGHLRCVVYIGQHWQAGLAAHLVEDLQAGVHADAALAGAG
mmetsp:Transcript_6109/g.24619  ORF Transcript_6109/g.24619 Transcript_6109/m.24619 type:complete len:230 (-) Transcript_6109:233-922(-)